MKKINLLHLITGLGVGGAEHVVLDFVKNIDNKKFNTSVVSMSKRTEMLEVYKKSNISVTVLKKDNSLKDFMQIITFLNNYVKENRIDIIHAHMTHALIAASIVKLLNPRVKIVFTSHSINMESMIREVSLFLLKPFRTVDILFSKDQLKYFYKKQYKCIPNGIDIKVYKPANSQERKFIFLAIGRLEKEKNHIALIDNVLKLQKNYDFEVWIAGEGELRKELESLIRENKIEEYIKLLGIRKDIPALLNKVHCLLLPSLWEGLPIAILEAGAAEVPIISTPVGSIPSLLDNENAYLSKADQFFEKMSEVMNNYDESMSKAKKLKSKIVAEYSIDSIVKKHEEIYLSLVPNKEVES